MSSNKQLITTYTGLRYELYIVIGSILTAYTYQWLDHKTIHQQLILVMLRAFIAFADLGIFLAIGHLIDFRRGVCVFYAYKILSLLEIDMHKIQSQWQFVYKTVGVAFMLMAYYKVTLILLVYTASHVVGVEYGEDLVGKRETEKQEGRKRRQQEEEDKERLFSRKQITQLMQGQEQSTTNEETERSQVQRTIKKIKLSLRHHKQQEFYKKLQVFYFIIYNSTCLLLLFPLQQHILDFTRALDIKEGDSLVGNSFVLDAANDQMRWLIDVLTVVNVMAYWGIVLVGEFWVKRKYPQLVKEYVVGMTGKFVVLQVMSLVVLVMVMGMTTLSMQSSSVQAQVQSPTIIIHQQPPTLITLINPWLFTSCYLLHFVLPLLIIFLQYRLYLGLTSSLNNLVSTRFSFSSSGDDNQINLDSLLYQAITQRDIVKVRLFAINDQQQLLPRHKLKRYTQQERLKHYVNQEIIIEVQEMFEDFLVLDLYNKLSRWLAMWIFYILLVVFLIGMTINDNYPVTEDRFYIHIPVILLVIGFVIVTKYSSSPNIFYPKVIIWLNTKYNQLLSRQKAYHFIRLNHFYAIIFTIWIYRIYAYICIDTHQLIQQGIKFKLYQYYTADDQILMGNRMLTKLLNGWAKYFVTHTAECDYGIGSIVGDSFMVTVVVAQLIMQRRFVELKGQGVVKKDPLLLFLKLITPLYALYTFVINMQCLQWSRVVFCTSLCVGVMFIHLNWSQLERGIKRNEQGQYED